MAEIAASIREFGWTNPVLVDEATGMIAGHGRLLAARQLGMAEVPVMVASGWSEAQKRAYVIADNKLALNAGWDEELLRVELGDLRDMGADLSLIGFGDDELAALLRRHRGPDRPRRGAGSPSRPGERGRRRLDPRPASAGLRRQHRRGGRGARRWTARGRT